MNEITAGQAERSVLRPVLILMVQPESSMKVALVHDCLRQYGDAERLLQVLHRMYPDAPVYTAFIDYKRLGSAIDHVKHWNIQTLAAPLRAVTQAAIMRSILPALWESLDLSAYDLVISSSGQYGSQAVLTCPDTLHISYCHTPPRDLWEPAIATPRSHTGWQRWLAPRQRQYDVYAAQRVDRFVTTSERAARRIKKFYRRQAEVIPPPVKIHGQGQAGDQYYLYIGPLTANQHVDLVVQACCQLELPLWIVGTGSEMKRLRHLAGPKTRFLGDLPETDLPHLYAGAKALIFPSSEADFAVTPVEAMGRGIPVIASDHSGLREVILNYRTGLLFSQPTVESLSAAIGQFEGLRFSAQACIERAKEFSESVFISRLEWFIAQAIEDHKSKAAIEPVPVR